MRLPMSHSIPGVMIASMNFAPFLSDPDGSGAECTVALTDQWHLTYGEDNWKNLTEYASFKALLLSSFLELSL